MNQQCHEIEPEGEEGATSSKFSSSESIRDLNLGFFSIGHFRDDVLGFFQDDDLGRVQNRIEISGLYMNE